MKFCLRILIIWGMLGAASLYAQQPNWLWAKSGGGLKQDQASAIAVDSAGEAFVTGYFQDSAIFSTTGIHSSKGSHFFLAKYSSTGSLLWIQTSPLTGHSEGTSLCISQNKYLYLIGNFSDSLEFTKAILFSASGTTNAFLAKYDLEGNLQWAEAENVSGGDARKGVASDKEGNAYICGSFSGTASFDAIDLNSTGSSSGFIAKFNPDGMALWAKGFSSHSTENKAIGICLDHAGQVDLVGAFGDTVNFVSAKLIAAGTSDIFTAQYDSTGNFLWAKQAGAQDMAEGVNVTTDSNNNIYLTGSFSGSATSVDCNGVGNILIAKYSGTGVLRWMRCDGTGGEENGNGIAVNRNGDLYVTGGYDFIVNFGPGPLSHSGLIDAFIVKLDSSGNAIWSDRAGGSGTDMGSSVALDPVGNIYLAGIYSDTCGFGSAALISRAFTDIFIAKMGVGSGVPDFQLRGKNVLSFYPNPATDQLNIEFPSDEKDAVVKIELFSLLGVPVKTILASGNTGSKQVITIPVNDLSHGTYFCRLSDGRNMNSGMIVIGD